MIQLRRGAEVTAEYLTSVFSKMYRKLNEVARMHLASTGQYTIEGTITTAGGETEVLIMEPMSTGSSQYFDAARLARIAEGRANLRREDSEFDFLARYREDVENIRAL